MTFKESGGFPIGEPQPLKKTESTMPVVEVENHVEWVNPDFPEIPLDLPSSEKLEEIKKNGGQISSSLGIFLSDKENKRVVGVDRGHGRSGLLGKAVFRDSQRNLYRDIDIKGLGSPLVLLGKGYTKEVARREDGQSTGIVRQDYAFHDRDMSEKLFSLGIRVVRVISIINLEQVVPSKKRADNGSF